MNSKTILIAMSLATLSANLVGFAQSTWSGSGGDANWNTSGNWDTLPGATGSSLIFSGTNQLSNTNNFVTGINGLTFDSSAGAFTLGGTAITIASSGNITNNSTSTQMIGFDLTNAGTTNVNATSGAITFTGKISTGSFNVSGGTVTIQGSTGNSNLAATVNNGSTLVLAKASGGGNAIIGTLTINDGGTVKLNNSANTDQIHFNTTVNMNGSGAVFDLNGQSEEIGKLQGTGGTVRNNGAGTATITVGGGTNNSDFSNILLANGTGVLAVITRNSAAGTAYTLGGANTYTGVTTIGGTTSVSVLANGGVASSIGASTNTASNLVISSAATLKYTGATATTDRGFTAGSGTSTIEVTNAGTTLTFSGNAAGITKTGAGTLVLSGSNSYSGLTVSGGTLRVANATSQAISGTLTANSGGTLQLGGSNTNQLHDNTTVAINSGGFFDLAGLSEKVKNISGSGSVINSGGAQSTLTVSGFSGSTVFDGVISGNIALTHSDASSSTTLNGLNTYSGNTTLSTATSSLVIGSTGGLTFYIGANGVNNSVGGAAGASATFNGSFAFDLSGASLTDGNSWTLVSSGLNKSFAASFAVTGFTESNNVWTLNSGQNAWSFSEATGILSLSVSAVPEPSTFAALAGVGALGAALLRRRRAKA